MSLKSHAMNVAAGVGAGLVVLVVLLRLFENRLIFYPPKFPQGFENPDGPAPPVEEIWLTASDGVKLNAYFLSQPQSPNVVLWFHGNAENIGMGLEHMHYLAKLGASVLAVDYRGYGKSDGSPDEEGVYRDADAAYEYLTVNRRVTPDNIFIYGHSLGGAVAVDLASRRRCGGLIVESSFTSIPDMARHIYRVPVAQYIPRSQFDSVEKMRDVHAPVLVIHGTSDAVVPFAMSEKLFQAAPEPKSFLRVQDAGHNDPHLVGGQQYFERLTSFLGN